MEYKNSALLLGAGFTKNFGGPLASELWSWIFNHPSVQESADLINLFLNEKYSFSFEQIYSVVYQNYPKEYERLYKALDDAFDRIDKKIINLKQYDPYPSISKTIDWMRNFSGSEDKKGFVFSLNQDLFFERHWSLTLPGISKGQHFLSGGRYSNSRVLYNPEEFTYENIKNDLDELSLIKMHGSSNWFSKDGSTHMVIGNNKTEDILKSPLFVTYAKLFSDWLNTSGRSLWVIGYGFRDSYLNHRIAEAIERKDLKLFIINPTDPREFLGNLKKENDEKIWKGVRGYFPYQLSEIFPISGGDSEIQKEINESFEACE